MTTQLHRVNTAHLSGCKTERPFEFYVLELMLSRIDITERGETVKLNIK